MIKLVTSDLQVQNTWNTLVSRGYSLGQCKMYLQSFFLQAENISAANEQVLVLGDQFQAALVAYDEGLLSNDKVLASALWRRFFDRSCDKPERLETMVKYIRQQVSCNLIFDCLTQYWYLIAYLIILYQSNFMIKWLSSCLYTAILIGLI